MTDLENHHFATLNELIQETIYSTDRRLMGDLTMEGVGCPFGAKVNLCNTKNGTTTHMLTKKKLNLIYSPV